MHDYAEITEALQAQDSPITEALLLHSKATERASDMLTKLEARLGPVLTPVDRDDSAKTLGEVGRSVSPFASELRLRVDSAEMLANRVAHLLERLEL